MEVLKVLAMMAAVILWLATIVGAVFGAVTFVGGMVTASSAPQQAAVAATSVTFALLPYVTARAFSEIIDMFRLRRVALRPAPVVSDEPEAD